MKGLKDYSEYIGQKFGKLTIINILRDKDNKPLAHCLCECGDEKDINFHNVRSGKSRSCGCFEKSSRFERKHANIKVIGQKYGKLTILGDSGKREVNGSVAWKCLCECGNITYVGISNLQRGHTTSCGCSKQEYIDSLKYDIIGMKFQSLTVIKELDRSLYKRRTYLCKCDCGKTIIIDGTSLTTGATMSCGCIRRSHGEIYIENLLNEYNIKFQQEYRFEQCRNKRRLPFDFYLPDHNTCIEFQGKQHYDIVDAWGGKEGLQIRRINDQIKRDFCESEGIKLIAIPYTKSKEEVKEIILNNLNP